MVAMDLGPLLPAVKRVEVERRLKQGDVTARHLHTEGRIVQD